MPFDWIAFTLLALLVVLVLLTLWIALRRPDQAPMKAFREELQSAVRTDVQQLERSLRDEVGRSAGNTRSELAQTLATFQQTLLAQQGDVARTQNEQIDSFRTQLASTQQHQADTLSRSGEQQALSLKRFSDTLIDQLRALSQSNDQRMAEVRTMVEQKLGAIQLDNEKKLEQMRQTVDEKLHATLEQRLGESFKQVADRLDQVHRGLGEMQGLAKDVGSLSRVLNNVKTRGNFGEVQLAALLEEVFTTEQFSRNVETIPGSNQRVDFALRLPGRRDDGVPLWLPIDAKFPREDYERLLDAQERADPVAAEIAGKAIEMRLRAEARRPKACMPRRCAGPGWSRRYNASTRSCWQGRPPCWPRSTACRWVFARSRWRSAAPKCGRCWAPSRPSSASSVTCSPRQRKNSTRPAAASRWPSGARV